jgi:hypothetical protein
VVIGPRFAIIAFVAGLLLILAAWGLTDYKRSAERKDTASIRIQSDSGYAVRISTAGARMWRRSGAVRRDKLLGGVIRPEMTPVDTVYVTDTIMTTVTAEDTVWVVWEIRPVITRDPQAVITIEGKLRNSPLVKVVRIGNGITVTAADLTPKRGLKLVPDSLTDSARWAPFEGGQ